MGMQPKISKGHFFIKPCQKCGGQFGGESFSPSKSPFFADGYFPICNTCIKDYLAASDFSWDAVDKICQYGNLPFVPTEFEKLRTMNGDDVFPIYAKVFQGQEFEGLGWSDYFNEFKRLRDEGLIEDVLPEIREEKYSKLREKWGANYDDEALNYLEELYKGLLSTQNVNGALQQDQAYKICKISYEIDNRIRGGQDFDKILSSYDKLVKVAEFTPKNVKNVNDFDSTGEVLKWLEKGGWKNRFYDNITRDVVDETMKNIQAWNQRLYTNENSIGEEITRRMEALQLAQKAENYYDLNQNYDLDNYENDGYDALMKAEEEEEFDAGAGGDEGWM